MTKLPDKPSELIRLALKDLETIEGDPVYIVDMRGWVYRDINIGKCSVCLAGCVMVQTLKIFSISYLTRDAYNKTNALNAFRTGDIDSGLYYLGIENTTGKMQVHVPEYKNDPIDFKRQLNRIADFLESYKL